MTEPAAFRATYSDVKLIKGRKVVQYIFEVPVEESNKASEVLGGMPNPAVSVWCAIARLDPKAVEDAPKPPSDPTDKTRTGVRNPLPQRAALLCKDELFHRFLEWSLDRKDVDEEFATHYLRTWCDVESRSQIIAGTPAAQLFGDLLDEFYRWDNEAKVIKYET
jgi:hypothetical protein